MKQRIYLSWQNNFNQWFFIEKEFTKNSFEQNFYYATLKTMRYISSNIRFSNGSFKGELKNDLKKVREFYLKNKPQLTN